MGGHLNVCKNIQIRCLTLKITISLTISFEHYIEKMIQSAFRSSIDIFAKSGDAKNLPVLRNLKSVAYN